MDSSLKQKDLIGSWVLKSFRVERPRKGLIKWANKVSGLLIYTKDGMMSVSINSFDSKRDSLEHMLFYSGTYTLKGDIIKHRVKNASSLTRIDQTMYRKALLTNKGRVLTIESLPPSTNAILVWKRVK